MRSNITYTSTLPRELSDALEHYAQQFKVPKNRVIENALRAYFDRLKKAEYVRSFQKANLDEEMLSLAEEGLEDYLSALDES